MCEIYLAISTISVKMQLVLTMICEDLLAPFTIILSKLVSL